MKLTDFLRDVGRPLTYYPSLARALGCVKAAIFLSNLIYWTGKQKDPDGWIYKSSEEIEGETGLPYDQQHTARKRLKRMGLIEERYARLDHRLYFRPRIEAINGVWEAWLPKSKKWISGNSENGNRENDNQTAAKTENPVSIDITSTTPSITTPSTPPQVVEANMPWPSNLTPAQLTACRRVLEIIPLGTRPELVAELSARLARRDLPPVSFPDLYLATLVDAARVGSYAPRYSSLNTRQMTDAEYEEIEAKYRRRLAAAETQIDARRAAYLTKKAAG